MSGIDNHLMASAPIMASELPKVGAQPTSRADPEKAQLLSDQLYATSHETTRPYSRKGAILSTLGACVLSAVLITHLLPQLKVQNCSKSSKLDLHAPATVQQFMKRADSSTDACVRYGQQSAVVNGTLFVYGGATSRGSNLTNNFITIDLKQTWSIARPAFSSLPQPSGVPAVAQGLLWNSYDSLFQFGGRFSDGSTPASVSLWDYGVEGKAWTERAQPQTSAGNNSDAANTPLQRVANGAAVAIPAQGRAYYFGGYMDNTTSANWSSTVPREVLRSMAEYTYPGYSNTGIASLSNNSTAGNSGIWRNITTAGIQSSEGFVPRHGHNILHVPGWGIDGVILSIAGGNNDTQTLQPLNIIEVYDVQTSQWYRQPAEGAPPTGRINACIATTAAADGSSFNIHMYGGQGVGPNASLYNDMWILSVPAFSWIQVNTTGNAPPARAGHSCNLWDGQMIVVGGNVDKSLACDSPGVYVFNTTSLDWSQSFNAVPRSDNPFSQQFNQRGATKDSGLVGSFGYKVPSPVQQKIGGGPLGGATVTVPLVGQATWAHTTSVSYDTNLLQATVTATATPAPVKSGGGTNVGAAVAGAVAGFFFLVAIYLALCALVYRQQIAAYKKRVRQLKSRRKQREQRYTDPWRKASWFSGGAGSQKSGSDDSNTSLQEKNNGSMTAASVPPKSPLRPSSKQQNYAHGNGSNGTGNGPSLPESQDGSMTPQPSFWGVVLHPKSNLRDIHTKK